MKTKAKPDKLELIIECSEVAKDFESLLKKGERPVTMILYRMPELRAYKATKRAKAMDYSFPLYRFFACNPDKYAAVLLPKIKALTEILRAERTQTKVTK